MNGGLVAGIITWAVLVIDLGIRITALVVVPRNRRPTTATAWLLTIFLVPILGALVFLVLGSAKLPRDRREKQELVDGFIRDATRGIEPGTREDTWPDWLPDVVHQTTLLGAIPMTGGNAATLIAEYDDAFAAMAEDIAAAERFVHVEFYIVALDSTTERFFRALEDAVARGVRVLLLLDHVASVRVAGHRETLAELDRIGVEWRWMLPVRPLHGQYQRPDLRNHRKLVVVDGVVGYTGSQNLIDRSYDSPANRKRGLRWQELVTRLHGPAVIALDAVFRGDWYSETGEVIFRHPDVVRRAALAAVGGPRAGEIDCQVVPSGPGYAAENNLRLFLSLLYAARRRIVITSPYFVPDDAMAYAITSAVQRGVPVDLVVSAEGDQSLEHHAQRSYYEELLRAGVRIWLYPAPYILHAKHLTIDDDVAVIGSSNMDIRSFSLNLEVSLLVHDRDFVTGVRAVEDAYRSAGRELTLDEWEREPRLARVLDGLARLTSGLQ